MSKGTRWIKRKIALLLVLLLSIESFGAIVSDNDGSAFITKAEFDSLKNDFQAQIDSYNTSIDSKIDGAIAAYLAGIRISTRETIVNANKVDSSEKDAFKFIKFLEKDELEASHVETYYDVSFECIKFSGSSKWDSDNIITHPKTWTSDYELAVIFAKTADPIQLKNNWNTYYDSAAARLWFCNSFLLSELTTIAKDNRCKPFYNVASQSVLTKVPYITKDGYVESWGQKALKGNFTALYEAARWGGIDSQRFHMYLDETLPMNTLKNVLYAEWNGRNARTGNILTDKVMTSKSINREQELKLLGVGSWKDGVSPEGTAGAGVYQPARFGGVSFSIVEAEKPKDKGLYIVSSVDDENDVKLNYIQENADVKADTYEYKDKTDEESCNKLREIFLEVNKANFDIKISNVKKKNEKPHKIDLEEAEQFFNQNNKAYEEKKNFHNKLVEKGNKLQEDRNDMIKQYEEQKKKLIDDSNDYVRELQKETDPNNPERKKLLEENENLKKQIQETIQEGLKMKDDFDLMLKESGLALDNLDKTKGLDIKNTLDQFQEKTTGQILLNTSLKRELLEIKTRNAELEKFKITAENQCDQFEREIKSKVDESMKLSYENLDMQNRIQNSANKQEVLNLIKEQQGIIKKINLMKSLNTKYISQYEELTGEKISKKKKKKKNKNKNKKKKDNTSSAASTTTEHDHDHDHEHCHGHDHEHENDNGDSEEEEEEEHHHCCCGEHHH